MLTILAQCVQCNRPHGLFTGPMSKLKTKNLLEALANIEARHTECLKANANLRWMDPDHPLLAD